MRFCCTVSQGKIEPCCEMRMPLALGSVRGVPSMRMTAGVGLREPDDHVHERGLAASRGTHDGDELAVSHLEAHVIDDSQRAAVRGESLCGCP
jgi:hypothetical protein